MCPSGGTDTVPLELESSCDPSVGSATDSLNSSLPPPLPTEDPSEPPDACSPCSEEKSSPHLAGSTIPYCNAADTADTPAAERNVWGPIDAAEFNVRIGPNYSWNRQKAPSGPAIARTVGVDLFRTPHKVEHLYPQLRLPPEMQVEGGHLLVLNVMLPGYAPSLWQKVWDGPGHSFVVYAVLSAEVLAQAKEATSGHLELLWRFLNAEKEPNPAKVYERMKIIGRLANPSEVDLHTAERTLISKYNGKPVLTRPQHKVYHGGNYTEVDVDVHIFGLIGRKGVHGFLPRLGDMILDFAFVLEAHTDEELPEVVLMCMQCHKFNMESARSWY
eukprot:RCo014846